jgi:hypothetical protein
VTLNEWKSLEKEANNFHKWMLVVHLTKKYFLKIQWLGHLEKKLVIILFILQIR